MKRILLICSVMLCMGYASLAQDVKYQYAQLIWERKIISGNETIHFDMGQRYKPTEDEQRIIDEITNYASNVDALNRLAQAGWEPIMVANTSSGSVGSLVIHTMRKKK